MFAQLVTNGTFDVDQYWTKSAGATISNGKLNVAVTGGGYQNAFQLIDYVDGAQYRMTAIVNGTSGKQMRFTDLGGLTVALGTITMTGADQNVELVWTATSSSARINIERQSSGDYSWTVDNIIISKLSPFNDIIKPADVPTPIFNDIIRTYAGEEPWHLK
jgi:hypothetical protein